MNNIINLELLKKYNVYGPRYTSYPTALQFTDKFTIKDHQWHIEHSNQDPVPKPLSLYIHIPFCQSLCYYCGCHKVITQNRDKISNYIQTLNKEIALQASYISKDREVKQIHFGGGTPTYLDTVEIMQLLQTIEQQFTLLPHTEIESSIEIDPRTTTNKDIQILAELGFNRMSFGIQDFDPAVQIAINRVQDQQETFKLIQTAKSSGIDSVSVDLIYGLPKQTVKSFTQTLDNIIDIQPNRIALYNYAHMPNRIKSQKLIQENQLPTAAEKITILSNSINRLLDAGYIYIGMDHFALPNDQLNTHLEQGTLHRNFQGYSTHNDCDIIGLGASAISSVGHAYSQNHKDIKQYENSINNQTLAIQRGYALSKDDIIRAAIIQQIMCQHIINLAEFEQAHHINFNDYFFDEILQLKNMQTDGLLILNEQTIKITAKGRLFLRNIAMIFDAHLYKPNTIELKSFSKVL